MPIPKFDVIRATDYKGRDVLFCTAWAKVGNHPIAPECLVDGIDVRPHAHDVVDTSWELLQTVEAVLSECWQELILQRVEPVLPTEEDLSLYHWFWRLMGHTMKSKTMEEPGAEAVVSSKCSKAPSTMLSWKRTANIFARTITYSSVKMNIDTWKQAAPWI